MKSGGKGIRTPDLLIANETLYQLSYTPKLLNINGNHYGVKKIHGKINLTLCAPGKFFPGCLSC